MTITQIRGDHSRAEKNLTPIIKSDDPHFNHEAAQKAVNLVMKLDDDSAQMFAYFVMADILDADIEINKRTLQRHLDDVVYKRIEKVKKALISTVSKGADETSVAYAQALAVIEKAYQNPYMNGRYTFDESDFRRDSSTGRFQQKVVVDPNAKKLTDRQAENLGIKTGKTYQGMSSAEKKQYQQEYMQIANFLNVVTQAGDLGDHNVHLRVAQKHGGAQHWVELAGRPKAGEDGHWDPKTERVVSVEARPTGLTVGGASFGLVNSLGHQMGGNTVRGINQSHKHFDGFADDWSNPQSDSYNSNQRLYSRVKTGSEFVGRVAPDGSKTQMAAMLGAAVGQHGPQAEKVLGPAARKTAYRYRGVEKAPDTQAVREYEAAIGRGDKPQLTEEQTKTLRARENRAVTVLRNAKATETKTPVEAVRLTPVEIATARNNVKAAYLKQIEAKPDPERQKAAALGVLGDHLMDRRNRKHIPKKDLYRLQLESGGTPPSEGFMLDKNGKIVAQAIGYGDDHYLPFNLKHLKQLRGGEYIRSRSVGGPTSEDIYTGLLAGAKRVTVVSRSGTFVIDFEDDFKGKRRYNDKAHRMVRRYEKLLDTVQSEEVERPVQIGAETRARIVAEVRNEPGAGGLSPRDMRDEVKRRITDYKDDLGSSREDFQLAQLENMRDLSDDERRVYMSQAMKDWEAHNEYKFRLNGAGYRDALLALEEQFPYYFSTEYIPRHETEEGVDTVETEIDRGYVEPGRNRPTEANAGWYGTGTNKGTGRLSASHMNYQRGRYSADSDSPRSHRVGGRPAQAPSAPVDRESPEIKTATGTLSLSEFSPEKKKEIETKADSGYQEAATALVKELRDNPNIDHAVLAGDLPVSETDDQAISTFFADKSRARKADEYITRLGPWITGTPDVPQSVKTAYANYKRATGQLGRVEYDPKLGFTRSGAPFLFPGAAYEPGADPSLAEAEANRIADRTQPVSVAGMRLSEMTDEDLNKEIDILMRVKDGLDQVKDLKGREKLDALGRLGIDTSVPGVSALAEGERLGRHAKEVQRMRALNLTRGDRANRMTQPVRPVMHLEPRSAEQTQLVKEDAAKQIGSLERAAAKLEASDDDRNLDVANLFRHRASEFKRMTKQSEIDEDAYGVAIGNSAQEIQLAHAIDVGLATPEQIENFIAVHDIQ